MPKRSIITSEDSANKRARHTSNMERIPENGIPREINSTSSAQGEQDDHNAKFRADWDDALSIASYHTFLSSFSMEAGNDRLVQFFGSNTGINTSDQDEYIEFKSLLNVPVGPTGQPDVSRIIEEIKSNPMKSIMLTCGYQSLDFLKRTWRTAAYANDAKWKNHLRQLEEMQIDMERLKNDCDEVRKNLLAVQHEYDLHENKVAEKRQEMQDKKIEVANSYELGVYNNTLYRVLRHLADDDNWSGYVGLPTESLFDKMIPEDATEEQLERMRLEEEKRFALEVEKSNKRYEALKANARAREEKANA